MPNTASAEAIGTMATGASHGAHGTMMTIAARTSIGSVRRCMSSAVRGPVAGVADGESSWAAGS